MDGIGTFTPNEFAHPTIGIAGEVSTVEETRIDYLLEKNQIEKALQTMRTAHKYEEVAHDLIPLSKHFCTDLPSSVMISSMRF